MTTREPFTDEELTEMIAEPCTIHLSNYLYLADALAELLKYRNLLATAIDARKATR